MTGSPMTVQVRRSWFEASARQRISGLVDRNSFIEFLGPEMRETSPHLAPFDLPVAFDDGIVVGAASLVGMPVLLAAQEGRFMGGAFGEVHSAKLTGLLRAAMMLERNLVIAFDTGGVRLQEANAGELAIAEIMRATIEARTTGVGVIGLIGGRAGCFGGGSLVAGCCSTLIISEQGRLSVSGPEVIETNKGVEEFDSRDRALVWRTMGGKHRYLTGGVDSYIDDDVASFRAAAAVALQHTTRFDAKRVVAEQHRLETRLRRFGTCQDGRDVWTALGVADAEAVPDLPTGLFLAQAAPMREHADEAR